MIRILIYVENKTLIITYYYRIRKVFDYRNSLTKYGIIYTNQIHFEKKNKTRVSTEQVFYVIVYSGDNAVVFLK